jgi:hypothetical protein
VHCILRGIYDTDGIAISGGVHLANEMLVRDIHLLMKYFGYDAYIRCHNNDGSNSYSVVPHNYGFNYREELLGRSKYSGDWQFSTLPYHSNLLKGYSVSRSQIKGESNLVVFERVKSGGSCEMRTFRKFFDIMNNLDFTIKLEEDYDYHIIERVENTGEEVDTYTLCVLDDSHQYVCEGMISHNTASDILKLVICRLWKKLLNTPEYHDDVRFLMTIHDEIQFGVRASRLNEITGIIEDCMLVHLPEWKVDIITEASFGFSSGGLFAWERVKDNTERGFTYRPKLD